ncbi:hypothetical protein CASFOL_018229 [Castilleja foliolosa]|uniref:Bifunctional inhibitor/plant lipid transfer protein/seed storage helical domain-containing protein n=1 Tax=Castilleja foliolosa TaxID=1961234 RepID=A0ABD3D9Y4_9LAMI
MKSIGAISVVAAWCLVVLLVVEIHQTVAVDCNVERLSECYGVITGLPPSPACCGKLKGEFLCYCSYLKDPTLAPYIHSPIYKLVVKTCRLTIPKC